MRCCGRELTTPDTRGGGPGYFGGKCCSVCGKRYYLSSGGPGQYWYSPSDPEPKMSNGQSMSDWMRTVFHYGVLLNNGKELRWATEDGELNKYPIYPFSEAEAKLWSESLKSEQWGTNVVWDIQKPEYEFHFHKPKGR